MKGSGWLKASRQVELLQLELRLVEDTAALSDRVAMDRDGGSQVSDFTHRLARGTALESLVAEVQRSCTAFGVVLLSAQMQRRSATPERLARADVNMAMRGKYPDVKRVVGEALSRHPGMTLHRLVLRRSTASAIASPTEVEVSVVLAVWGAATVLVDAPTVAAVAPR